MPHFSRGVLLALALLLAGGLGAADAPASATAVVKKKGIGLAERKGLDGHQLDLLKVGWYYNWGSRSSLGHAAQFVPMIFSLKTVPPTSGSAFVLGYNEPDHPKQSNLAVKEALGNWPEVAAQAQAVISPAMAGNPLTSPWLTEFMKAQPKVDGIAVHWYKGAAAAKFIKDLEEIHAHYQKPLWITEFAPQTAAGSAEQPDKFSQAEVNAFIATTTAFMEKTPWVQRYAWHDSKTGTSALFDAQGELTATGKAYAAAGK